MTHLTKDQRRLQMSPTVVMFAIVVIIFLAGCGTVDTSSSELTRFQRLNSSKRAQVFLNIKNVSVSDVGIGKLYQKTSESETEVRWDPREPDLEEKTDRQKAVRRLLVAELSRAGYTILEENADLTIRPSLREVVVIVPSIGNLNSASIGLTQVIMLRLDLVLENPEYGRMTKIEVEHPLKEEAELPDPILSGETIASLLQPRLRRVLPFE